jgi:MarR family transcriptional regulator, transcriptional regulator for hemolysin
MDRLNNFGFLLKDVSRRYVSRFERHAEQFSLTLVQCRALAHLEKNEGISQARLAELTEVEPMAMVRILDRMEADGVLERRPDPDDRRARRLHLTAKAKPLLEEIWRLAALTRAETFAGIARVEREAFIDVLERLDVNLLQLDAVAVRPAPRSTGAADGKSRARRLPAKQES